MTPEPVPNDQNDWTIMFFFASDNPLAPLIVSQLKAIKDAGFQEHTDVLVHFDPMEKGLSTKIYNVNQKRKDYARTHSRPRSSIGDGKDPYVRNMTEDEIDPKTFSPAMRAAMADPRTLTAETALLNFVDYGIRKHPAKNYMLFLVGHGMIVGRDTFLPDDDPISAITLVQLQGILDQFRENEAKLQLLALHSCSMSSVEVAYQLRGRARFLMATQGVAFANSWPYRQLLKKILNTIDRAKNKAREDAAGKPAAELEEVVKNARVGVTKLVEKLYYLCLHNATDFLSAGYSADLVLCSLEEDKVARIKEPLQNLVRKLKSSLCRASVIQDLIVLAHWESQSFWEENYTDLYDFCLCLKKECKKMWQALNRSTSNDNQLVSDLLEVSVACDQVTRVLDVINSSTRAERFKGLVIHEDNFGWKYQYARGLSVYFPWHEPLDDDPVPSASNAQPGQPAAEGRSRRVINAYRRYDFTSDFGKDSWLSFLESYFDSTKRPSRMEEEGDEMFAELFDDIKFTSETLSQLVERAERVFNSDGSLGSRTPTLASRTPTVGSRTPETGASCECPSIKNYPTDMVRRVKKFSITAGALKAFRQAVDPEDEEDSPEEDDT